MTTRFECPKHGAMKPGQILHNGHTYTCSICGQGLRANSEDTRDAEIVRLRAENAALAAHVELLDGIIDRIQECDDYSENGDGEGTSDGVMLDADLLADLLDTYQDAPETSLTRLIGDKQVEAIRKIAMRRPGGSVQRSWLLEQADEWPGKRRQAEATS